jgi:hypothetical protein
MSKSFSMIKTEFCQLLHKTILKRQIKIRTHLAVKAEIIMRQQNDSRTNVCCGLVSVGGLSFIADNPAFAFLIVCCIDWVNIIFMIWKSALTEEDCLVT